MDATVDSFDETSFGIDLKVCAHALLLLPRPPVMFCLIVSLTLRLPCCLCAFVWISFRAFLWMSCKRCAERLLLPGPFLARTAACCTTSCRKRCARMLDDRLSPSQNLSASTPSSTQPNKRKQTTLTLASLCDVRVESVCPRRRSWQPAVALRGEERTEPCWSRLSSASSGCA